jgi:hypothetical protein
MFAPITYLLTALATGYQLFWLRMWGVWGRVASPWENVACVGVLGLIIAACEARWRSQRFGAWFALGSLAFLWVFYAPATFHTLRVAFAGRGFEPLVLVPSELMILATILAARAVMQKQQTG